jgi:hypothetical protein
MQQRLHGLQAGLHPPDLLVLLAQNGPEAELQQALAVRQWSDAGEQAVVLTTAPRQLSRAQHTFTQRAATRS